MIIPGEIGYDLRYYAVKLTSKTATNLSDYVGSTLNRCNFRRHGKSN